MATILAGRYHQLELALIDAATAALAGSSLPEGAPMVSAETAVKLLTLRSATLAKDAGSAAAPAIAPDELRRTLAKRLAAVRHVASPAPAQIPSPE